MKIIDFNTIKNLNIPLGKMYEWTSTVWKEQDEFLLAAKISIWQEESGRYMTMPCVLPKYNVAGVKFISRNIDDSDGIPARNSNIMLQSLDKHGLLATMDGTYITTMRTGACAAYNAITFARKNAKTLAIYGLGLTARTFLLFYADKLTHPMTIRVMKYKNQAEEFISEFKHDPNLKFEICTSLEEMFKSDIIVSCVSFAHKELAPVETYPKGCTIIPVHTSGFQNCDLEFEKIFVDDIDHVKKYRYYEQFKDRMARITDVANGRVAGRENEDERILVYNGGIALTDMYWALQIVNLIGENCPQIPMTYPIERFWINK
ncbi:MAG: ornithine cyclodeaminase [Muribaculaceae bacterium]|nr:ornithine cyclodeaminase [Muribaculaceae bacterium]